jgi:hypothetical protein
MQAWETACCCVDKRSPEFGCLPDAGWMCVLIVSVSHKLDAAWYGLKPTVQFFFQKTTNSNKQQEKTIIAGGGYGLHLVTAQNGSTNIFFVLFCLREPSPQKMDSYGKLVMCDYAGCIS